MTLRDLLEKATGDTCADNYNAKLKLRRVLGDCAEELLKVAEELENIVNAKRFSREHFRDDTEYADWLQSRGRAALRVFREKEGRL